MMARVPEGCFDKRIKVIRKKGPQIKPDILLKGGEVIGS